MSWDLMWNESWKNTIGCWVGSIILSYVQTMRTLTYIQCCWHVWLLLLLSLIYKLRCKCVCIMGAKQQHSVTIRTSASETDLTWNMYHFILTIIVIKCSQPHWSLWFLFIYLCYKPSISMLEFVYYCRYYNHTWRFFPELLRPWSICRTVLKNWTLTWSTRHDKSCSLTLVKVGFEPRMWESVTLKTT